MTIRARLVAAFTACAVLLGAPLVYGIVRLQDVRAIAVELRTTHAAAFEALGILRAGLAEFDRHIRSFVISPDASFRTGAREALIRARRSANDLEAYGFGMVAAPLIAHLDSLGAATVRLETLVDSRRTLEATELFRAVTQPALVQATAALGPLDDAVGHSSTAAAAAAQDISAAAATTATVAAGLALLLGLLVAIRTTASLTGPLHRLRSGMASVAGGVFVPPDDLPYGRRDEIGDLSRSFETMTARLAELDRVRGEFLNVLSHDLKAPLNLIGGCAELIDEEAGGRMEDSQRELLASIREHVVLLTARVNRLLSLGRLEADAYPVHPEAMPVAPTFAWIERSFAPEARRRGVEFSVRVEPGAPDLVRADPECLYHEIVGNLLSNAFKFTPRGGRIGIRVWSEHDAPDILHFSVIDTGPGIPDAELPNVFGKYYQVGRGAPESGAGLGLAIVRKVVEAHGGTVRAERSANGGACFHITLPAIPQLPTQQPRVTPVLEPSLV